MSDISEQTEKDQPSRRRSAGRHHFSVKPGGLPVWRQVLIIITVFGLLLMAVTYLFHHLDQTPRTAPTAYGPGEG